MISRGSITAIKISILLLILLAAPGGADASERIAVIAPEASALTSAFAEEFSQGLASSYVVIDPDLAKAAYESQRPPAPFNLSSGEGRSLATVIGSDLFVEIKAGTQRRNASERGDYYEAYAVTYLVSGRTGRLLLWDLKRSEAGNKGDAENGLLAIARATGRRVGEQGKALFKSELKEPALTVMEEPPPEGSREAKNFKAPIPFRRMKPDYTPVAAFYDVAASVEIEVDLDAAGKILRTQIVKWAGFGLDESVENAVRQMNWRPAERNGKFLPMRFLLRYNFRKVEKE